MSFMIKLEGNNTMIKFKQFIELYDNWNGRTRVNDDNLETIVEDFTVSIADRTDLFDKEVVAFGFYDSVLTIRIR